MNKIHVKYNLLKHLALIKRTALFSLNKYKLYCITEFYHDSTTGFYEKAISTASITEEDIQLKGNQNNI